MSFRGLEDHKVATAIDAVSQALGVSIDRTLLKEYLAGFQPDILAYEKLSKTKSQLTALQRFLIAAESHLAWPKQFYEIFRSCRPVLLLQRLAATIPVIKTQVGNFEGRFQALKEASDFDTFDSILFEILTAASYAGHPDFSQVCFIDPSPPAQSPDIETIHKTGKVFIECKNFNRSTNASIELRDHLRTIVQPTLAAFFSKRRSYLFDCLFLVDPLELTKEEMQRILEQAVAGEGQWLETNGTRIKCNPISALHSGQYVLYPSPQYYYDRYGFKHSDWLGIISTLQKKDVVLADNSENNGLSTWIDEVPWECAFKWKLANDDVAAKYRKIGYKRIFEGLDQLGLTKERAILHVAFENEKALGARKEELLNLFHTLKRNQRDRFSWLILHEKLFDVSYKGIFDLIEHAHPISGPTQFTPQPPISVIYTNDLGLPASEFGEGHLLPDIDEIHSASNAGEAEPHSGSPKSRKPQE